MYLTDLATVVRRAGLTIVEQPGWQTRGHGGLADVRAVICHHTAGPATGNAPSLGTVQNGRPDLPGPLAQLFLARDGTVFIVAAGLCYHAGAVKSSNWDNAHAIGIEAEATGTSSWPASQVAAYATLCRALVDAYGAEVLGHKEVCSPTGRKIDPNFDMAAFRVMVARAGTSEGDDVQLDDKVTLFGKDQVTVNNVLAGTFARVGEKTIPSKRYPGVKDDLAGFISAIDANVLSLGDGLKQLAAAQVETNTQLAKIVELLTPKDGV